MWCNSFNTWMQVRDIRPLPRDDDGKVVVNGPSAQAAAELSDLVASLVDTQASDRSYLQGPTSDACPFCCRATSAKLLPIAG